MMENSALKNLTSSMRAILTDLLQQCSKLSAMLFNDLDVILFASVRGTSREGLALVKILTTIPEPIPAPQEP